MIVIICMRYILRIHYKVIIFFNFPEKNLITQGKYINKHKWATE